VRCHLRRCGHLADARQVVIPKGAAPREEPLAMPATVPELMLMSPMLAVQARDLPAGGRPGACLVVVTFSCGRPEPR
jgi:hypothetical protein